MGDDDRGREQMCVCTNGACCPTSCCDEIDCHVHPVNSDSSHPVTSCTARKHCILTVPRCPSHTRPTTACLNLDTTLMYDYLHGHLTPPCCNSSSPSVHPLEQCRSTTCIDAPMLSVPQARPQGGDASHLRCEGWRSIDLEEQTVWVTMT